MLLPDGTVLIEADLPARVPRDATGNYTVLVRPPRNAYSGDGSSFAMLNFSYYAIDGIDGSISDARQSGESCNFARSFRNRTHSQTRAFPAGCTLARLSTGAFPEKTLVPDTFENSKRGSATIIREGSQVATMTIVVLAVNDPPVPFYNISALADADAAVAFRGAELCAFVSSKG